MNDFRQALDKTLDKIPAKVWMNEIVDIYLRIESLSSNNSKYEAYAVRKETQMSMEGLEHLAHAAGQTIVYDPNWCEKYPDTGEAYIMYRGHKFCAIWNKRGYEK